MTGSADGWIRRTTTGCVALLALIAATVSYLDMRMLVELHGQPGWVAALTPLSVDGMIVAASTTLLADSRAGQRGGVLPWALLAAGSTASLAPNVAVAQPTLVGRVIAAWPSFALIGAYEMLMRQVRRAAADKSKPQPRQAGPHSSGQKSGDTSAWRPRTVRGAPDRRARSAAGAGDGGSELQRHAWQWALAHRGSDGSIPSGREIASQYGRHERWGRLVKSAGIAGQFSSEPSLQLVPRQSPSTEAE